jgi:hypothetical protein
MRANYIEAAKKSQTPQADLPVVERKT